MWSNRDRLLAAMFGVQLVAALIFGLIVANGLSNDDAVSPVVADGGAGTSESTAGSTATGGSGAGSTAGTSATGSTTDGGSQAGSSTGDATDTSGGATAGDTGDTGGATSGDPGGTTAPSGDTGNPDASAEGTRTGVTDTSVKIGVLVTQTGAINFRSSAQATKAYIDMINEQGGVNGRRIEMLLRDDGLDENKGQAAVDEMINAGIFSFVAFNAPLTEQSVIPVIEKNEIPLIGAFAIPSSPMGYIFSAPYETYGKVGGDRLGREGTTTAGLVYLSNQVEETDRIIEESWRSGLAEHGIELSDDNIHPVDVTKSSFDDVVTSLRLNGVDGIGTILDATAMKRLQQSMNRAAYEPIHVSSPFGGDPAVLQDPNVGESFEGTFVLSDVEFLGSSSPEVQRYEQETSRRFGDDAELNWAGQHGWIGARIFVDMLSRLTDPTREGLLAQMNSLRDYETGFTAPLTITEDPATHNTNNQCMKVGKVVNGKVEPLTNWMCPPLTLSDGGVA